MGKELGNTGVPNLKLAAGVSADLEAITHDHVIGVCTQCTGRWHDTRVREWRNVRVYPPRSKINDLTNALVTLVTK